MDDEIEKLIHNHAGHIPPSLRREVHLIQMVMVLADLAVAYRDHDKPAIRACEDLFAELLAEIPEDIQRSFDFPNLITDAA